jgi:hypothetical protein
VFRFSEEFRCDLTVALLLLLERSTAPAFLVVSLLRVVGFTVVDRSLVLLLALLFRMFPSPAFLVLLLVLFMELLLSVADLPVFALLLVVLSLDTSGRYTLTALLLTLVDRPERLFVLSSLRTVAVLPVVRS